VIGQKTGGALAEALRHPRYEVIPLDGTEEAVVEHVPKSIGLTVTASPAKGLGATIDLAGRLARHGYRVAG
jgi:methylenetetrahydrofolate reductase (NADPH)